MVAYRETIRKTVEKYEYTHKKQTGGSGQFAKVQVSFEPLPLDGEELYEFRGQGHRWPRSSRVHPLGRCWYPGRYEVRCPRWLPDGGREGNPD